MSHFPALDRTPISEWLLEAVANEAEAHAEFGHRSEALRFNRIEFAILTALTEGNGGQPASTLVLDAEDREALDEALAPVTRW